MNDHFYHLEELISEQRANGRSYLEFLRVPAMSAGVYFLPRGTKDLQSPHQEDEMYYVVKGKARIVIGAEHADVPGIGYFCGSQKPSTVFMTLKKTCWCWCSLRPRRKLGRTDSCRT